MKPTDAAIRATNLGLQRDHATLLRAISLEIQAGSVVGLVGRNGAPASRRCCAAWPAWPNRPPAPPSCSAARRPT